MSNIEKISKYLSASKFTKGFEKFFEMGYEGAKSLESILHKYNIGLSDLGKAIKDAMEVAKQQFLSPQGQRTLNYIEYLYKENRLASYVSLSKTASNKTVSEVLNIKDKMLDNAFVVEHGTTLIVNIESNNITLTDSQKRKLSDKVFELKPKLLEKFPKTHYVEINTH